MALRKRGFFISRTSRLELLASRPTSRAAAEIKALAKKHSKAAIRVLAAIMNQADGPATARVSAAQALLDRGWGKAAQPVAGEDGGLPVLAKIERVIVDASKDTNSSGGHPED
jgi:hypothetical protein